MNTRKWEALLSLEEDLDACTYPNMEQDSRNFFVQGGFYEYIPPKQYPRILDLGCGCGIELKVLHELGYLPTGITKTKRDIEYAKQNFDLDIRLMDMHDLEFPSDIFDGAVARQSLEHAYSPLIVLMETRIVLKPGGRLLIDLPSPHNKEMWSHNHRSIMYPTQMRYYFNLCGLSVIHAWESSNQTLGYNGGGETYRYVVEKGDISQSTHRIVLEKLEMLHKE